MCEKSVDKILSRKVDCYDYLETWMVDSDDYIETCMLLDGLSCQMRRWQTAPVLHHLHQPSKFSWIPLAFTHPFQRENLHASFLFSRWINQLGDTCFVPSLSRNLSRLKILAWLVHFSGPIRWETCSLCHHVASCTFSNLWNFITPHSMRDSELSLMRTNPISRLPPLHLYSNHQGVYKPTSDNFTLGTVRKSSTQSETKRKRI